MCVGRLGWSPDREGFGEVGTAGRALKGVGWLDAGGD